MHFPRSVFAAICLAAFSGCAVNEAAPDTAQANVSAEAADEPAAVADGQYVNKVVCKRIVATGSRTNATKTCATVAEWEELSRSSQDATNELSRRTGMSNRMDGQ